MPLVDTKARNAKGLEKAYKLSDGGGLYLLVQPNGSKLWRVNYRHNGKQKTLAVGQYPLVTLAQARAARDAAKKTLSQGIDPSLQKKLDRVESARKSEITFGLVADEYIDRLEHLGRASATVTKNKWLLETLAGDLRSRPIADISAHEILTVLQKIERRGKYDSAHTLRSVISSVFRFAVASLRASNDPTFALRGALKPAVVRSRAAITDEKQLGTMMKLIGDYPGWPTLRCALQFTALSACRPGEVRGATWSEMDEAQRKWVIPAQRMKMRKDHEVPLCHQAMRILAEMKIYRDKSPLVFPTLNYRDRPLSENAMNSVLRRIGFAQDEHTAHGFRSSFSTIMNERGFDPEIIEDALAHKDQSVRSIYNRARKWEARTKLMQDWADLIDTFQAPEDKGD